MREELDALLCKKYPEIFKDRNAPITETSMCWGFSIGDGWFDLIDNLCEIIMLPLDNELRMLKYYEEDTEANHKLIKQSKEKIKLLEFDIPIAAQVKEKFGGLRFYAHPLNERTTALISVTEGFSFRVCEECGNKGKLYKLSWHKTLCEKHAIERYGEKRVKEYNESKTSQEDQ